MDRSAAAEGATLVVAMDSFKESLTAAEACAAVARGLRTVLPRATILQRPLADGGEGTIAVLQEAYGGRRVGARAAGPIPGHAVVATWLLLPDRGPGALIEMAAVNGLGLLAPEQRDPMRTSTRGTGELVADAIGSGVRTIWLAVGGSATVDGGTGAARALGWHFEDAAGDPVPEGGGGLERIHRIVPPLTDRLRGVEVRVLCDVDNPLVGPRGAAAVFGPQKGAGPAQVRALEAGLTRLAERIEADLGMDLRRVPGGGAAGGLAAGAMAFLGAELVSGVDAVLEACGLDEALADADLVVTGEGALDAQSLDGKVVSGVVRAARIAGIPVAVVAGSNALGRDALAAAGIRMAEVARPPGMPLAEALERAEDLVERAAAQLAERWLGAGE